MDFRYVKTKIKYGNKKNQKHNYLMKDGKNI